MQTLIKISSDQYIVVDDSEIKEGDYYLFTWGGEQEIQIFSNEQYADRENHNHLYTNACKKITHSTEPLEDYTRADGKKIKVYVGINPLNLFEVKELIGEVDVEKKIKEWYNQTKYDSSFIADPQSYKAGYNQALEDNKDRKYTEEDLRKMFDISEGLSSFNDTDDNKFKYALNHIQPKTEWEVEIVDGKLKLKQ